MSEYDAIVVGSGAGGGFAALGLCEAGMRVLVLERGRAFDPRVDYPMNYPDWELRPRPLRLRGTDPTIVDEPGPALSADTQHLCSRRGGVVEPAPCRRRGRYRYQRVYGLGGTTLHYQGEAHRFAAHAFMPHSSYGFGDDWPVTYADLAPYYQRAEQVLGVAGDADNPFKPAREAFPTPAHSLSPASAMIGRAAKRLGWSLLPNSLALPTRSIDGRSPCRRSGGCVQGCIFGAKSSTDVSALARARRSGRLTIFTGARVLRLENRRDRVSGVIYEKDGKRRQARAAVVVLAMGAVETPRLLLASTSSGYPKGLGNEADNVGRYYLDMVFVTVGARFDGPLTAYQGPPIDARIWDFARPQPGSRVRSGYVLGVSGTMNGYHGPLSYARRIPGIGLSHKKAMREQFGNVVSIFAIAEQEPRRDNRLLLSDRVDDAGVPMVRVQSTFSDADRAVTKVMIDRCQRLAQEAGAVEMLGVTSTYNRPSGAQVGGSCRMGRDPEKSVTDPWGRVHGVRNLFVTDASVLPGQGAGDALSLTIQALALRTARRIADLHRRKEL